MNDKLIISKNGILAFLVFTAVVLGCAWTLIGQQGIPSSPAGITARAGYYVITTTASPLGGPDMLWIANVETQQLMVYDTKPDGTITPLAAVDLEEAFQPRNPNGNGRGAASGLPYQP